MRDRIRVITTSDLPSKTRQSEKDNCDINIMVAKMVRGEAVNLATGAGAYGDFSNAGDFTDNRHQIQKANEDFMKLPSKIRQHFSNDVQHLLEAFEDPDQADELREFGLLPFLEETEPPQESPTPETPPATPPEPPPEVAK